MINSKVTNCIGMFTITLFLQFPHPHSCTPHSHKHSPHLHTCTPHSHKHPTHKHSPHLTPALPTHTNTPHSQALPSPTIPSLTPSHLHSLLSPALSSHPLHTCTPPHISTLLTFHESLCHRLLILNLLVLLEVCQFKVCVCWAGPGVRLTGEQ